MQIGPKVKETMINDNKEDLKFKTYCMSQIN